jgi:hypothetical protein
VAVLNSMAFQYQTILGKDIRIISLQVTVGTVLPHVLSTNSKVGMFMIIRLTQLVIQAALLL